MSIHNEMAEELDSALLKVLREGQVVITDAGPVTVTPTAAMLNQVRQRLKDLGVTAIPAEGTPTGNLIKEARRGLRYQGKEFPALSEEPDAAAA